MFSGVHNTQFIHCRSQYIELLLKCLAAGKKLTCTNNMLLVNFYLKALLDNISVYIMLSLKEK